MRERVRAFIEAHLPWYDAAKAHNHDQLTERIRRRSIRARIRSEKLRDASTPERLASYGRVSVGR